MTQPPSHLLAYVRILVDPLLSPLPPTIPQVQT